MAPTPPSLLVTALVAVLCLAPVRVGARSQPSSILLPNVPQHNVDITLLPWDGGVSQTINIFMYTMIAVGLYVLILMFFALLATYASARLIYYYNDVFGQLRYAIDDEAAAGANEPTEDDIILHGTNSVVLYGPVDIAGVYVPVPDLLSGSNVTVYRKEGEGKTTMVLEYYGKLRQWQVKPAICLGDAATSAGTGLSRVDSYCEVPRRCLPEETPLQAWYRWVLVGLEWKRQRCPEISVELFQPQPTTTVAAPAAPAPAPAPVPKTTVSAIAALLPKSKPKEEKAAPKPQPVPAMTPVVLTGPAQPLPAAGGNPYAMELDTKKMLRIKRNRKVVRSQPLGDLRAPGFGGAGAVVPLNGTPGAFTPYPLANDPYGLSGTGQRSGSPTRVQVVQVPLATAPQTTYAIAGYVGNSATGAMMLTLPPSSALPATGPSGVQLQSEPSQPADAPSASKPAPRGSRRLQGGNGTLGVDAPSQAGAVLPSKNQGVDDTPLIFPVAFVDPHSYPRERFMPHPDGRTSGGAPVYCREDYKTIVLEYVPSVKQWQMKDESQLGQDMCSVFCSSPEGPVLPDRIENQEWFYYQSTSPYPYKMEMDSGRIPWTPVPSHVVAAKSGASLLKRGARLLIKGDNKKPMLCRIVASRVEGLLPTYDVQDYTGEVKTNIFVGQIMGLAFNTLADAERLGVIVMGSTVQAYSRIREQYRQGKVLGIEGSFESVEKYRINFDDDQQPDDPTRSWPVAPKDVYLHRDPAAGPPGKNWDGSYPVTAVVDVTVSGGSPKLGKITTVQRNKDGSAATYDVKYADGMVETGVVPGRLQLCTAPPASLTAAAEPKPVVGKRRIALMEGKPGTYMRKIEKTTVFEPHPDGSLHGGMTLYRSVGDGKLLLAYSPEAKQWQLKRDTQLNSAECVGHCETSDRVLPHHIASQQWYIGSAQSADIRVGLDLSGFLFSPPSSNLAYVENFAVLSVGRKVLMNHGVNYTDYPTLVTITAHEDTWPENPVRGWPETAKRYAVRYEDGGSEHQVMAVRFTMQDCGPVFDTVADAEAVGCIVVGSKIMVRTAVSLTAVEALTAPEVVREGTVKALERSDTDPSRFVYVVAFKDAKTGKTTEEQVQYDEYRVWLAKCPKAGKRADGSWNVGCPVTVAPAAGAETGGAAKNKPGTVVGYADSTYPMAYKVKYDDGTPQDDNVTIDRLSLR